MRPAAYVAAALSALVLVGCDGGAEPSAPPTSEPALTTATATPEAAAETSEAEATTAEPTEAGPPEMPDDAMEQTEAGAEAFALHYIDLINYTGMHPEVGLLEPLAADGCEACSNYSDTVEYSVVNQETLAADLWTPAEASTVLFSSDDVLIRVPIEEHEVEIEGPSGETVGTTDRGKYVLNFDLEFDNTWKIRELTVEQS